MSEIGQKMITAVREVAKEFPDHFSQSCQYLQMDYNIDKLIGDCIIGRAFEKMGLVDQDFNRWLVVSNNTSSVFSTWANDDDSPVKGLEIKELAWLETVQAVQDDRKEGVFVQEQRAWANGVEIADTEIGAIHV